MRVNGNYGNNYSTNPAKGAKETKDVKKTDKSSEAAAAEKSSKNDNAKRTDTFTRSEKKTTVGTDYRSQSVKGMKNEAMKDMVAQLISGQAKNATGGAASFDSKIEEMIKGFGLTPIKSDGSEDFWGAEKTANRILDMAKSLVGDDEKAFAKIKAAFEKGFGESEKMWGGKLPSVCYDTLDKVRSGFDAWEKEKFSGSSEKTE